MGLYKGFRKTGSKANTPSKQTLWLFVCKWAAIAFFESTGFWRAYKTLSSVPTPDVWDSFW